MKFRTEIEILPYDRQLSYDDRLLALGSCFATEIGRRMAEAKFRIAVNPSGVLFNPLSIVRTLRRYRDGLPVAKEELQHADGRWFHYDFHGSLAGDTADEALTRIDAAVAEGARALHEASAVLLTLGTAWVYERTDTGDVVANCHRQPAERQNRRRGRNIMNFSTENAVERSFSQIFRSKRWSRRSNRFCRTNRAANESCSPSAPSVIWATDWRAIPIPDRKRGSGCGSRPDYRTRTPCAGWPTSPTYEIHRATTCATER